jgi:hypothetical protein
VSILSIANLPQPAVRVGALLVEVDVPSTCCSPLSVVGLGDNPNACGVGDRLPAHFAVGFTRLACRHVLTLGLEEPKARAGGVGHSGDAPEAVVGSLGEHRTAKRGDFRDRGVDIVALPEH